MKPNWKDAPEWAQWLAMHADGWWYWFSDQPDFQSEEGAWLYDEGECESASRGPDQSGIDWDFAHSTLECRP
jgi:hypothetical protein